MLRLRLLAELGRPVPAPVGQQLMALLPQLPSDEHASLVTDRYCYSQTPVPQASPACSLLFFLSSSIASLPSLCSSNLNMGKSRSRVCLIVVGIGR